MTPSAAEALKTAAAHWSGRTDLTHSGRHWWEHPAIVRYVNSCICGFPLDGLVAGDRALIHHLLGRKTAPRAVSVGCGAAFKEIVLLRREVVGHFDLYEISESRVELGKTEAAKWGLEDRIAWHTEPMDFESSPGAYDLVYWNNALHHMLDTRKAIAWSRETLAPDGLFYMNDFVGPDRMQWSDEVLAAATRVREALPPRLLKLSRGRSIPTTVTRPDPDAMAAADPSECADSAAIVPALREAFPGLTVRPTGGVVYHVALSGILERIMPEDAEELFGLLLQIDQLLFESGLTNYAVAYNR